MGVAWQSVAFCPSVLIEILVVMLLVPFEKEDNEHLTYMPEAFNASWD